MTERPAYARGCKNAGIRFLPFSLQVLIHVGKRRNVLRNRTDSWDYDIDQLLLGTMLFTLVSFLFPTVLVYYALFATVGDLPIQMCDMADIAASESTFHIIPPRHPGAILSIPKPFPVVYFDAENERSGSSSR